MHWLCNIGKPSHLNETSRKSVYASQTKQIDLQNIVLARKCNSNLIFQGQLRKTKITFHDSIIKMALIKNKKIIVHAKSSQNFFILKLATPKKAKYISHKTITPKQIDWIMALKRSRQAIHLINKNKRIKIWHC